MVTGLSVPGACARCCLTQSSGPFSLPSELRPVLQGLGAHMGAQASNRNLIFYYWVDSYSTRLPNGQGRAVT